MPRLKVDSFGTMGVNVVDSPLHLSDDDLTNAQNAEIFFEDGYPAIRKRLGMVAGITGALSGPVFALTSIPLVDPAPSVPPPAPLVMVFYWVDLSAEGDYQESYDGTDFLEVTLAPATNANLQLLPRWPHIGETCYFPTIDTPQGLVSTTGSGVTSVFEWPDVAGETGGGVRAVVTDGTNFYCIVAYLSMTRVWKVTPAGVGSAVGADFTAPDNPIDLEWWNGRLWVLTAPATGGQYSVQSIDPESEVAWTAVEGTHVGPGGGSNFWIAGFLSNTDYLFVAWTGETLQTSGYSPTLRRRDTSGTWSTILTYTLPVNGRGSLKPLWADDDALYVCEVERSATLVRRSMVRVSTDFSSFTDVDELSTALNDVVPSKAVKLQPYQPPCGPGSNPFFICVVQNPPDDPTLVGFDATGTWLLTTLGDEVRCIGGVAEP